MASLRKILVVDDERDFCKLILMMFEREPYQIECAFNLREAAQIIQKEAPEVILLDNNLPDGTGLDFVIKSREIFEHSRVILITADTSFQVKQKAIDAGVQYLAKPFELKKIREFVKSGV